MTGTSHGMIWRMMHIPLSSKVVTANCVVVTLAAVIGVICAIQHVREYPGDPHYDLINLFAATVFAISLVLNGLVMKVVLAPLDRLQAALEDIGRGEPEVRLTAGPISDEQFDYIITGINQILNTQEQNAQQLHHFSHKILQAQEEERRRIARELHDEAAQTLTSLLLYIKLLEKSQNQEEAQRIQNLRNLTVYALDEIRGVAMALHPKILDEWGLEAALGQYVEGLKSASPTQVTLQVIGGRSERLPRELELAFYRTAQEGLNNIVRHAHAQSAQLILKRQATWLTMEIQDDGIGFDAAGALARQPRGMGLSNMSERLALVKGELVIESQVGKGTWLLARAPISPVPQWSPI